jgi:signal transduction histidine kinase
VSVELGPAEPGPALLRDPSVRIVYRLPNSQVFVDDLGTTVAEPLPGRARTLVRQDGALVAAVEHATDRPPAPDAVQAAGPGLLRARTLAELAAVRASRARIMDAADAARRNAERVLHDGAQQRLLSVALVLRMAEGKLAGPPEAVALLREASGELAVAFAELRELARGVYPVLLTDAGLGPALAALVDRSPVPAELVAVPDGRFAPPIERSGYFVVFERLADIAERGLARSVEIAVRDRGGTMDIEVRDDGPPQARPGDQGARLQGLEDRVAACGGSLGVLGSAAGTVVRAVLPCG